MGNNQTKHMMGISLASVAWFLLLSLMFNGQLKIWYLYWTLPVIVMICGYLISRLNKVIIIAILVTIGISQISEVVNEWKARRLDIKMLHQQKGVVDQVMSMGKDEDFAAYVYTESIYDYPYQFLWWWKGQKTGKGPLSYSYLPDKYDYAVNKKIYDPVSQPVDIIYLIMEKDNPASDYRWETWLKAFYEFELVEVMSLENGVKIEKRVRVTELH